MSDSRLKIIGWGLLLSALINGSAYLLGYLTQELTVSLVITIFLAAGYSLFAGYMVAIALYKDTKYKEKWNLTAQGAIVALIAGLFSSGLNYYLTGEININSGVIPLLFGGLGAYLVERKRL